MLLAYRDWRTITWGAVVIADHTFFCYLQHNGFGIYVMSDMYPMSSPLSMVVVHAAYLVVQTIALCILSLQMEKDANSAE